ncbi:hypothetical protein B0J13DRAFT_621378 [Dactylonectria estremocensis]|uniref:Glycosyltransferase family 31 protein n=1 Tax=Dactylonectria estremocensis TaxID=1079267 RepID=A0A9P9J613_9HYPO|nr:hypothetical protein B0J13DRAFT_621378 [Dactylonectria estremocensis]
MGFDLSSSWSSPRGWKLISLTLIGLTLLLLVPLYQLSDHDYSHLTKYLGNIGDTDSLPSATTLPSNTEPTDAITEDDIKNHDGVDDTDLDYTNKSEPTDIEEDGPDNTVESFHTTSFTENKPTEESKPGEEAMPKSDGSDFEYEHLPEGENTKSPRPTPEIDPQNSDNSNENQNKSEDGSQPEGENKPEEQNDEIPEENKETPNENNHGLSVYPESRTSPCDGFPSMDGIMLVMKTGATEAFTKLPTQLLTGLQCIDDFLIFSDLEQQVGKYRVYNVLDNVKPEAKGDLMEFSLYDVQANCPTSQQDCTRDMKGGWELDKYKFLHMIERAWTMRPNMEWYVFAEADSYVFWPNLVWWLRNKLNPRDFPYVGSVAMLKNFPFAHGGSGYVLSGQTVKAMAETPGLAHKYDLMAPHECCGDYLMALAVNDTGSKVKQAHPMFNGEKPSTLPYSDSHWCQALMTMHHMNSEEVSQVWDYEQKRTSTGFVQIKDMYEAFVAPHLVPRRDNWDNLSDDVCFISPDEAAQDAASDREKSRQRPENEKNPIERQAHFSAEHCSKVCTADKLDISQEEYDRMENESERFSLVQSKYDERSRDENWNRDRQCFQWRYHKKVCCVQRSFKLGQLKKESNVDDKWTSGWFVDGINNWIAAKGQCETEWRNMN